MEGALLAVDFASLLMRVDASRVSIVHQTLGMEGALLAVKFTSLLTFDASRVSILYQTLGIAYDEP
jgi:hypothetical protein